MISFWSVSVVAQCAHIPTIHLASGPESLISAKWPHTVVEKREKEKSVGGGLNLCISPALEGLESLLSKEMRASPLSSPQARRGVPTSSTSLGKALFPMVVIFHHTKKRLLVVEIHLLYKYLLNTYNANNQIDI